MASRQLVHMIFPSADSLLFRHSSLDPHHLLFPNVLDIVDETAVPIFADDAFCNELSLLYVAEVIIFIHRLV